jgi:hypothetical protein
MNKFNNLISMTDINSRPQTASYKKPNLTLNSGIGNVENNSNAGTNLITIS